MIYVEVAGLCHAHSFWITCHMVRSHFQKTTQKRKKRKLESLIQQDRQAVVQWDLQFLLNCRVLAAILSSKVGLGARSTMGVKLFWAANFRVMSFSSPGPAPSCSQHSDRFRELPRKMCKKASASFRDLRPVNFFKFYVHSLHIILTGCFWRYTHLVGLRKTTIEFVAKSCGKLSQFLTRPLSEWTVRSVLMLLMMLILILMMKWLWI